MSSSLDEPAEDMEEPVEAVDDTESARPDRFSMSVCFFAHESAGAEIAGVGAAAGRRDAVDEVKTALDATFEDGTQSGAVCGDETGSADEGLVGVDVCEEEAVSTTTGVSELMGDEEEAEGTAGCSVTASTTGASVGASATGGSF